MSTQVTDVTEKAGDWHIFNSSMLTSACKENAKRSDKNVNVTLQSS